MKIPFLYLTVFFVSSLHAQYYYNDIVGTNETNRQMSTYNQQFVKTVSATGYDANGSKATDFSEFYEVKEQGKALKVTSITNQNKSIMYSVFDGNGRVIKMIDSFSVIQNNTSYEYNTSGNIYKIENVVIDSANAFNQVETHIWLYNTNGRPEKMWRIVKQTGAENSIDSLEIRFVADEKGNIIEERSFKKGVETNFLYYYYDDENRMTDIVRYNKKLEKLIPDIMFEYDDSNRVIQKITTTSDRVIAYLIWRYIFNDKGLKTKEALFDNDKKLKGKIDYSYTFFK
ncbi:MAG TPA: hypothetical protein PKC72_14730 [Chitinophagaceae bacterium]|nr:hypothetical protein [Chitinophagaceae bacterium]